VDPNAPGASDLKVSRDWKGDLCRARLVNSGKEAVRVRKWCSLRLLTIFPRTLTYTARASRCCRRPPYSGKAVDLGYSERTTTRFRNLRCRCRFGIGNAYSSGRTHIVLGFASCKRFNGRFFLRERSIEIVVDMEGLEIAPNSAVDLRGGSFHHRNNVRTCWPVWQLRSTGTSSPQEIRKSAHRLVFLYCFGPRVTSQDVLQNLDTVSKDIPSLRYVQIDDGYQPAMGDWLETGKAFGGDVLGVLKQIRNKGSSPRFGWRPSSPNKVLTCSASRRRYLVGRQGLTVVPLHKQPGCC